MKSLFGGKRAAAAAAKEKKQPLIESLRSIDETNNAATAAAAAQQQHAPNNHRRWRPSATTTEEDVSIVEPPSLQRILRLYDEPTARIVAVERDRSCSDSRSELLVPPEQQQQHYMPPLQTPAVRAAPLETEIQPPQPQVASSSSLPTQQQRIIQLDPDPALMGEHSRSVDDEDVAEQQQRGIEDDDDTNYVQFTCFPQQRTQQLIPADEIATKIPAMSQSSILAKLQAVFVSSGLIYVLIVVFTAAAMVYGVSDKLAHTNHRYVEVEDLQVAFLGNAYLFVNDIPRLLEAVSQGHVYQNSCLHSGGSLSDLLITGNGMYSLWQTDEAVLEYSVGDDELSESVVTYDYGLCTVAQILQGYDDYISYGNKYGKYYSDGLNPCIIDPDYAGFVAAELERDPVRWDYVVLVEQTKRMAVEEARTETVDVLTNKYGPLLQTSGAIPVIVDTHAFWSSKSNMTGLTDIPTFTALISDGAGEFSTALASFLPKKQAPLIAPIGLAYLTVWEEDYDLWEQLFLDDQIHSSMYGSYLFACVLYATLFGRVPSVPDSIAALFMDARKIVGQPTYPSADQAEYLRAVAGRVALQGYVPQSLLDVYDTAANDDNNNNR